VDLASIALLSRSANSVGHRTDMVHRIAKLKAQVLTAIEHCHGKK
jgi:hypothetical protein